MTRILHILGPCDALLCVFTWRCVRVCVYACVCMCVTCTCVYNVASRPAWPMIIIFLFRLARAINNSISLPFIASPSYVSLLQLHTPPDRVPPTRFRRRARCVCVSVSVRMSSLCNNCNLGQLRVSFPVCLCQFFFAGQNKLIYCHGIGWWRKVVACTATCTTCHYLQRCCHLPLPAALLPPVTTCSAATTCHQYFIGKISNLRHSLINSICLFIRIPMYAMIPSYL